MNSTIIDTNILAYYLLNNIIELPEKEQNLVEILIQMHPKDRIIPIFILSELDIIIKKVAPKIYNIKNTKENEILQKSYALLSDNLDIFGELFFPDKNDFISHNRRLKNLPYKLAKKVTLPDTLAISLAIDYGYSFLSNDEDANNVFNYQITN